MSELENLVEAIEVEIDAFQENAEIQIEKGTNTAGAKARKASNNLTKLFKEFRKLSVQFAK